MMRTAIVTALVILFSGLLCYFYNLPQEIGLDVPEGKLNSLSFAPFREGQNPILELFPSSGEIDEDLALLADKTHSIRTYASSQGLKDIPAMAGKYGLEMIQGAWLGSTDKDNRREIEALVTAANAYPDVIKRVIAGNEVLLRGELEPPQLVEYIREVKRRVKQPVSYADVWSMYMKYPELIKEVDFITIHILPYWEDEPIPVDEAPRHIERIFKQVRAEADRIAPGKRILIGESGWPSSGKQRGWSEPGVVNEAAFIRGLLKVAADNGFDVNIVEAFNQSWKSELEGVVGANWGLFSVDREEVFPLTGKVYENVNWFKQYLAASLIVILTAFYHRRKLRTLSLPRLLFFLCFLQVLSSLLAWQISYSWYTSFDNWQRFKTLVGNLLNIIIAILMIDRVADLLVGGGRFKLGALLSMAVTVVILFALYKTYVLAVDGRYISFPFEFTLISIAGLLGLFTARCLINRKLSVNELSMNRLLKDHKFKSRRNRTLCWVILAGIAGLIAGTAGHHLLTKSAIADFPVFSDRLSYAFSAAFANRGLPGVSVFMAIVALIFYNNRTNKPLGWLILMAMAGLVVGETVSFVVARDFIQAYPDSGERLLKAVTFTFVNRQLLGWLACLAVFAAVLLNESKRPKPWSTAG